MSQKENGSQEQYTTKPSLKEKTKIKHKYTHIHTHTETRESDFRKIHEDPLQHYC